jgi:hypothetical protein
MNDHDHLESVITIAWNAHHDIALMDQYDARRLVLHDGGIHVYD